MSDRPMRRDNNEKEHQLGTVDLSQGNGGAGHDATGPVTTRIDVAAGRVLCREGARGGELFVIIDGEVAVTVSGDHLATLGPGDTFGAVTHADGRLSIATVTTTTPARLLVAW